MSATNKLDYLHNATFGRKRHATRQWRTVGLWKSRAHGGRNTRLPKPAASREVLLREKYRNQDRFLAITCFEKLRESTVSFVMSVRLLIRTEHLGCHWTDFYEIRYLKVFRNYAEKVNILLKSDTNNGYLT